MTTFKQAVPTRCIRCGGPLDGSVEHPFPQAFGALKASKLLFCNACNNDVGDQIDGPFTAVFEMHTTALDVRRARGEAPTLKATTLEGQKIWLGPGGMPLARDPSTSVVERDGKKEVTITLPLDRPDLHPHMIAKVAKELGVDASKLTLEKITMRTTSAGIVNFALSLGDPEQLRGAAKIAFGFLALVIGDDVFASPFARLRGSVFSGSGVDAWCAPSITGLAASFLPTPDGAQHRVIIFATESETWAHVEVFGVFAYAVLLAEESDARFSRPYVWGHNAITGENGEGWLDARIIIPQPKRETRPPRREDIAGLRSLMHRRAVEIAHERTIEEEIALLGIEVGEGNPITSEAIAKMSRRLAQRWIAMDEGSDLDLSLPIEDQEALQRVSKALREVGKRRTTSDEAEPE